MSVEAEVASIIANLTRIRDGLSDVRGFETHEHELQEIDGRIAVFESATGEDKNVIRRLASQARELYVSVVGLIESLIATSDWCNCEWYDDLAINPTLVARVTEYLQDNPHDESRCVLEQWGPPEKSTDADLTRIRWTAWRAHLISACIDPTYRPQRKGAVRGNPKTPFTEEELPGKSFTAIRVFDRIRRYVYYNKANGALYYRCLNEDGETVSVRRILCQEDERRAVFSKYWNDPGICSHRGRTTSHARFLVSFLGISRLDVELFIKDTELYQVSSKHKVIPKVVQPLVTSRPMEHMQADLVDMGAFQSQNTFRYILVMVDLFSKFLWARPLKGKDGPEVESAIMDVLWNEGFPTIFQTDNGGEFVLIGETLRNRGVLVRRGRSYKPSSQGQVERTNRTLKQAFYMDFLASENYNWETGLYEKVYAYNTLIHSAIRKTPYEIHRCVRPRNAPEFGDIQSVELLTTYLGGAAKTILGNAPAKDDSIYRAMLEDERLLISKWGEDEANQRLLPSLVKTSVMVAKADGDAYSLYEPVKKSVDPRRIHRELAILSDRLPTNRKRKADHAAPAA
jgi:hypothetical protein